MDKKEITDIIYDTLMGNTDYDQIKTSMVQNQECSAANGNITFKYGNKLVTLLVNVEEDLSSNDVWDDMEKEFPNGFILDDKTNDNLKDNKHIEGCNGKICNGLCKCDCHYI